LHHEGITENPEPVVTRQDRLTYRRLDSVDAVEPGWPLHNPRRDHLVLRTCHDSSDGTGYDAVRPASSRSGSNRPSESPMSGT
jgi:hypothetical protein